MSSEICLQGRQGAPFFACLDLRSRLKQSDDCVPTRGAAVKGRENLCPGGRRIFRLGIQQCVTGCFGFCPGPGLLPLEDGGSAYDQHDEGDGNPAISAHDSEELVATDFLGHFADERILAGHCKFPSITAVCALLPPACGNAKNTMCSNG